MSESQDILDFPCRFPIKAMGRREASFRALVVRIISKYARVNETTQGSEQASSAGKFVSVTVVIQADSRQQLDDIYQDLTDA